MRSRRRRGMIRACLTWWDLLGAMLDAWGGIWRVKPPLGRSCSSSQSFMTAPEGARSSVDAGHTHQEPHRWCGSGASSTELSATSRAELRPALETYAGRH